MGYTLFLNLLAMIFSINIFINSGVIDYVMNSISFINYPKEIIMLIISKPISGSASLLLLKDIFNNYGVDSFLGILASSIQGSTDTTFYVITLYYGSIGIKKIRSALITSLIGDLISIGFSIVLCHILFG